MLLKYFYDERLAQASYLVGCAATGEALVVDPMRDIRPYLQAAEREGLRITHVTETHIHADFVSGSRELAGATAARLLLSDEGDADWKYAYAAQPGVTLLHDGDSWMVGNIRIEVLHTPGHTPEHLSFLLTDTAGADQPMGIFTGDFLFVGDVGRPDLLEEAAGLAGTSEPGARRQFQSIARVKHMPDYLQVWPGHGAGSACGKALGAIPSTTLGYEKLFNPAFQHRNEDAFVSWLLEGQPEAPRYFARMKHVNKVGPDMLADLEPPVALDRGQFDAILKSGALVVDFRHAEDYAAGHVPGTISIPATNPQYNTYVGWFVDFAQPFYFVLPEGANLDAIVIALRAVGVDNIPGYFPAGTVADGTIALRRLRVEQLGEQLARGEVVVIDVRGKSEYATGHIDGAINVPLGHIPRRLANIPRDRPLVAQCASGLRSQIGASVLQRFGYNNVATLDDPEGHWQTLIKA